MLKDIQVPQTPDPTNVSSASSNTGELSIVPTKITLLSPCFQMLPHKGTLKEVETRFVNLIVDLTLQIPFSSPRYAR